MFSTFDVYIAEASDENLERDLLKRFIVTYLTQDDLDKILAAVKASNPTSDFRIKSYEIASNGTVTITYKDGTKNTV